MIASGWRGTRRKRPSWWRCKRGCRGCKDLRGLEGGGEEGWGGKLMMRLGNEIE